MSISDSITDIETQEAMADSLVGPVNDQGQAIISHDDDVAQQDFAEQGGQLADTDRINQDLWNETANIELDQQEAEQQQYEQQQVAEQSAEPTPQAVQEAVAELDSYVTERGLVDPGESALLATALGVNPENSAALGSVVSKVAVSALSVLQQSGGDLSQVGQIPRENARQFTSEFLRACGVDPRSSNADPEALASVVMNGTLSFLQAVQMYGLNASLDQLNSAEASEWFANALFQCFGQTQQVDRAYALNLADSAGRYLLSVLRKLDGVQQSQPRQGRSQSRGQGRRAEQKSSGRSPFKSNADLFDQQALDEYALHHGRL